MVEIATSIKIPSSGSLVASYGETCMWAARLYLVVGFLFPKKYRRAPQVEKIIN
jgi:hypothetical protein